MTTSQGRDTRGGGRPPTRRFSGRRRRQCVCKEVGTITYKDVSVLRRFISDRGRIESGRKSGNCAKCQRELSTAISRARFMGLLPYAPNHLRVTGSIAPSTSAAGAEDDEEPEELEEEELDDVDEDDEDGEYEDDESDTPSASVESSEDEESDDEDDASGDSGDTDEEEDDEKS